MASTASPRAVTVTIIYTSDNTVRVPGKQSVRRVQQVPVAGRALTVRIREAVFQGATDRRQVPVRVPSWPLLSAAPGGRIDLRRGG